MRGVRGVAALGLTAALMVGVSPVPAYAADLEDPRCVRGKVLDVAGLVDFPTLKQLRLVAQEFPRRVTVKVLTYDGLPDGQDLAAALQSAVEDCGGWGYEPGERRSLFLLGVDAESDAVASIFDGRLVNRFEETRPAAEDGAAALLGEGDVPAALAVALGTYAAAVEPGAGDAAEQPPAPDATSDPRPQSEPSATAGSDSAPTGTAGDPGADDESGSGLLIALIVAALAALAALGLLGARRRGRRRLDQQAAELGESAAALAGQIERLREQTSQLQQRSRSLPDHDDRHVVDARAAAAAAVEAAEQARRHARQVTDEHAPGPAGDATAPPAAERVAAATAAYAAARADVADASAQTAAATQRIDDLEAELAEQPARIAAARAAVDALEQLLENLRAQGYRTSDYDHVASALSERLAEASRLHGERRPSGAAEILTAVEEDVAETRRRLERLDEERADLVREIEALGARTPALDRALEAAHRSLAELAAAVDPVTVEEPRTQLDEASAARAALPRLLRAASEEASVERQQLVHARRDLSEAVELFERADRVAAEVRVRLAELAQVAQELPISADRTAARAQRLAERALRQDGALGDERLEPHLLGDRARALGDEARGSRPDIFDIAVRLDALRHEVADAERRLEDLVTAYAARRLAVNTARTALDEASATLPADAAPQAAASLRDAADLLARAEAEPDHVRAGELAEAATRAARRVRGEGQG